MPLDTTAYTQLVGDEHRRQFGQYFTPPVVADFMRTWVLASGIPALYDPAFGMGAFFPKTVQNINFKASEIDAQVIDYYNKTTTTPIAIHHEDYLLAWGRSHGNIICNPPYMRFQHFTTREKVAHEFETHLNLRLPGHTNTASAFLLKSLSELDGHGRLAYIMPVEFLNTGYGNIVKKTLVKPQQNHLVAIIKLECEKDIFPDVITSVCILLYDAANTSEKVAFHIVKTPSELTDFAQHAPVNTIRAADLDPSAKWAPYFQKKKVSINKNNTVPLSYYGHFSRGIATGANEFFILTPSKAKDLGLTADDYRPCITRSAQIRKAHFNEDNLREMLRNDESVLLFSANGNASPAAQRYIALGQQQGYHERFLTRHRSPWYKTEHRSPAPLLMGVFSRGGYKIILNESGAANLTCYHGFQPNLFGGHYTKHLFLYLLSATGREVASLSMRNYGDSLDKFEPNDINAVPVPSPDFFDKLTEQDVVLALQSLKSLQTENNFPAALEDTFRSALASCAIPNPAY